MIPLRRQTAPQHDAPPDADPSIGLCLTDDDARAVLEHWHGNETRLGFSYFRAGGGLIQSGHAFVFGLGPRSVTLDTGDSRLAFAVTKACVEFTSVDLFAPGVEGTVRVDGLSISLENQDWLFLSADAKAFSRATLWPTAD
jgi:hypothetical protein